MKTLVLATVSAAALMVASAASAQTVEQKFQNGRDQLNAVAESQSFSRANSSSSQQGDNNSATIDQAGNTNAPQYSTVIQGWSSGTSTGSSTAVTQRGNDDRSVVMQRNYPEGNVGGNSATVGQSGDHKNAYTYQYGNGNSSSLTQSGAADTGTTGSSVHTQADTQAGEAYTTEFHSVDGTDSHGEADAGGRVIQDEAIGNSAILQQDGSNQKGTVVQWYAESNSAAVYQSGSTNTGLTYQTGHASSAGISQSGNNNIAGIFQVSGDQDGAMYGIGDSYSNSAQINQVSGSYNVGSALQGGHNNTSGIAQTGGYKLTAGSYQLGSGQQSTINQNSGMYTAALVDQRGVNGSASVAQSDNGQAAYVNQNGTGNYNYATITQAAGAPNVLAVAYQNGAGNSVSVYQH